MRRHEVAIYDDLDSEQDVLTKLEEPEVRVLSYIAGGKRVRVRLDLTEQHAKEMDDMLAPYLKAGTEVDSDDVPRAVRHGGGRRMGSYNSGLKAWADEQGRSSDYTTPSGGFWPKKQLRDDYAKFLEKAAGGK